MYIPRMDLNTCHVTTVENSGNRNESNSITTLFAMLIEVHTTEKPPTGV